MNARWCHRCHAELAAHQDGTLQFCSHCGAPQIRLSEELKERAELRAAGAAAGPDTTASAPQAAELDQETLVWRDVMRFAVLSAGVSAMLALLSGVVHPMLLIGWLWAVVSPIVLLGMFHARNTRVKITAGFGARLGLLAGLANAVSMGSVYALAMFIARRAHLLGNWDRDMQTSIHNAQVQVAAQMAAQNVAQANAAGMDWIQSLNVPDFRAGMMLAGLGVLTMLLLVVSTAGGAFAGFMRRPRT